MGAHSLALIHAKNHIAHPELRLASQSTSLCYLHPIMVLAKERIRQNPQPAFAQGIDPSSLDFFGSEAHLPTLFDPTNSPCHGFVNPNSHEAQSSTNHHWAYSSSSSSVLSFEQEKLDQEDDCALWLDPMDQPSCVSSSLARDMNSFEMASEERFGLLYPGFQDGGELEAGSQKRAYIGGNMQASSKKQCGNNRKAKAKPSVSKDPQSIAAKNRRERISERLKVLQDLVPNGTKVDLVTMLEKAISYVKFLQLQVKVLATDEFWPAQGRNAPEVSQVKDAIDAILSSHRDSSSSSKQ